MLVSPVPCINATTDADTIIMHKAAKLCVKIIFKIDILLHNIHFIHFLTSSTAQIRLQLEYYLHVS